MAIHIEHRTGRYNERRYSRPYIAVVDFASNHQGACKWGEWVGSPATAEECAEHVRKQVGELGIDSAELEEAKRRLEATTVEQDFCRAVAACL